ncbi:NAD(P)-dependent oxidoreductase [Variovorax terrae]|uniref:NAD(P)H-binding protein n=1 Tax=Variovorax terrae TaxID=2923278 RepID=A0A9X2APT4_9BURK|nr:NAD(P)H-binding protein [Variovorax terrae]MCJ0766143.1 NAD(P)H-binding protein [Variovorax terrae]
MAKIGTNLKSRVAVIGATGRAGGRIIEELLARGHSVTAIARGAASLEARPGLTPCAIDARDSDALARAIEGHDAVISAARFSDLSAVAVIAAVQRAAVARVLVVGGAASLRTADGMRLFDSPTFPEAYRAEAGAGIAFLEALQAERSLDWTFLSPAALFDGQQRTAKFRLGLDNLLIDAQGVSQVSFPDYAIAMVDELEAPAHRRQRFHVAY